MEKMNETHNNSDSVSSDNMPVYEFDRYVTTAAGVRATLEKYGVAIVPQVLSDAECDAMVDRMWAFLEHITQDWECPIVRASPSTYRSLFDLFPSHSMLLQHFQVGHSAMCWEVRQHPAVVAVFATLWGCAAEDLLASFDGASVHLPGEVTGRGFFRKTWHHCDQSFQRNTFECAQGWVTGVDVREGDATLCLYEGSHRWHKELRETFGVTEKKDWYKLTAEQEAFYVSKGCVERRIKCPKGSLVLWDSRTIHCGVEAQKGRRDPNVRVVSYVCYTPRAWCDSKMLSKKIAAFEALRMTTHWPHRVTLFGKRPNTYGAKLAPTRDVAPPILTALGRRLVGYSSSSAASADCDVQPAAKKQKCVQLL